MPAIRHPKVSVSPTKIRNGMHLRGGARAKVAAVIHGHQEDEPPAAVATTTAAGSGGSRGALEKKKKTSSTTKGQSKGSNAKSKAEKAAAKIANIAHVATIEDALAKGVKEAASAPPHRPAKGMCSMVFVIRMVISSLTQCDSQQRIGKRPRVRRTVTTQSTS